MRPFKGRKVFFVDPYKQEHAAGKKKGTVQRQSEETTDAS